MSVHTFFHMQLSGHTSNKIAREKKGSFQNMHLKASHIDNTFWSLWQNSWEQLKRSKSLTHELSPWLIHSVTFSWHSTSGWGTWQSKAAHFRMAWNNEKRWDQGHNIPSIHPSALTPSIQDTPLKEFTTFQWLYPEVIKALTQWPLDNIFHINQSNHVSFSNSPLSSTLTLLSHSQIGFLDQLDL